MRFGHPHLSFGMMFGLMFGLFVSPITAQAAEADPVLLTWSVPEGSNCPGPEYAGGELRRYLGHAHTQRRTTQAGVVVRRVDAKQLELVLRTEQGSLHGERRLRDESCYALVDAAVVILAWVIDPEKMATLATDSAKTPQKLSVPQPKVERPAPVVLPRRTLRPFLGIALPVDIGTLPGAAFGAEVRLGASLLPVRWATYVGYWPESSRVLLRSDGTAVGGRFSLLSIGLQGCLERALLSGPEGFAVNACVGPELDSMHGSGFGVNVPGAGRKTWVSAVLEFGGRLPLGKRFQLVARLSGVLPSVRENFSLEGVGPVHQAGRLAVRGALGVELHF